MSRPTALAYLTSPPGGDALDPRRSEDELIAYTLIQSWALITGRVLRRDVPPDQLTEAELIGFWADPAFTEARS